MAWIGYESLGKLKNYWNPQNTVSRASDIHFLVAFGQLRNVSFLPDVNVNALERRANTFWLFGALFGVFQDLRKLQLNGRTVERAKRRVELEGKEEERSRMLGEVDGLLRCVSLKPRFASSAWLTILFLFLKPTKRIPPANSPRWPRISPGCLSSQGCDFGRRCTCYCWDRCNRTWIAERLEKSLRIAAGI